MVQFTDLPTDIVDQILACLPDFQTLAAAIKVSKEHTYNVFQEHRQTILTSVGLNLVGSSLIHALRVALCQNRFGISVDLNYEESLDAATEFLASLTLGQRRFLEDNAVAVQALEDIYSQIYKDRRARTSVLSDAESTRFRIALYRVWLLCWAACAEEEEEEPEDVDDEEEGAQENGNWADMVARLVKYDTPELQDIIAATSFLQVMFQRAMNADPHNVHIQNFMFLPSPDRIGNPGLVYEWLRDNTWREPSEGVELSATTFNHIILDKVCLWKNLDKETTLAVGPQRFIVQVNGVDDTCFGCNEVHGADLYGRANWNLLAGTIGFASIKDWLPGNLSRNTVETRAVFDIVSAEVDSDWSTFTEEIFDVQETDEEEVWDKEQWYCKTCITKLFRTRFPKWWMARPQNANTPVKDDCWYGWNCRTQIHRLRHAQNLNHFCEPSRDDGKTPAEAWTHGN